MIKVSLTKKFGSILPWVRTKRSNFTSAKANVDFSFNFCNKQISNSYTSLKKPVFIDVVAYQRNFDEMADCMEVKGN